MVETIEFIKTDKVFSRIGENLKTKIISKLIFSILDFMEIYFDIYSYDFQGSLKDTVRKGREYVVYFYGDEYVDYAKSRRDRKLIHDKTQKEWLQSELKYLNEFMELQEKKLKNW